MRIAEVELAVNPGLHARVTGFYLDGLGFEASGGGAIAMGESRLLFSDAKTPGNPFYHFAFLAPGDRFTAVLEWLESRASLLPNPETGSTIFDFDNWDALACYVLDPAGNIVEFIAHRGLEERGDGGPFLPAELIGISEVGLVCHDKRVTSGTLEESLGLSLWDGDIDDPRGLAFVGERARTLILCPPLRPWLPTARPAESHPIRVILDGVEEGGLRMGPDPHVVVGRAGP